MLKFTKPVIIKKEKEEEPVKSQEIETSADIGGTEPIVLQQEKPPVILQAEQPQKIGTGTLILIIFVCYIVVKLMFIYFTFGKVLLLPEDSADGQFLGWAIFMNTWYTLFAYFKPPCGKYNPFCCPSEALKEEFFQGIKKVASSVVDPEVSSILTSLSQL